MRSCGCFSAGTAPEFVDVHNSPGTVAIVAALSGPPSRQQSSPRAWNPAACRVDAGISFSAFRCTGVGGYQNLQSNKQMIPGAFVSICNQTDYVDRWDTRDPRYPAG